MQIVAQFDKMLRKRLSYTVTLISLDASVLWQKHLEHCVILSADTVRSSASVVCIINKIRSLMCNDNISVSLSPLSYIPHGASLSSDRQQTKQPLVQEFLTHAACGQPSEQTIAYQPVSLTQTALGPENRGL